MDEDRIAELLSVYEQKITDILLELIDIRESRDEDSQRFERLERIESKLDFMLRQNSRKESVALPAEAYSPLAQAGINPRELATHKVVTALDDWNAEQVKSNPPQVVNANFDFSQESSDDKEKG